MGKSRRVWLMDGEWRLRRCWARCAKPIRPVQHLRGTSKGRLSRPESLLDKLLANARPGMQVKLCRRTTNCTSLPRAPIASPKSALRQRKRRWLYDVDLQIITHDVTAFIQMLIERPSCSGG